LELIFLLFSQVYFLSYVHIKKHCLAPWLMPVIPVTQDAEIRRIKVQSQPGEIVLKTLSQKNPQKKNRTGGVAQGVGPEFKPQDQKPTNKQNIYKYIHIYTLFLNRNASTSPLFILGDWQKQKSQNFIINH
jgi:hypothetical protein